jgi:Rod binding domain-containing protein
MENSSVMFPVQTESILPVRQIDSSKIENASEEKKKQAAKDFESLLLNNLLDRMKETIGEWGFEKDGVSSQVDGIFWLYLARDMADKGGLGLWKEIYNSMPAGEQVKQSVNSSEGNS